MDIKNVTDTDEVALPKNEKVEVGNTESVDSSHVPVNDDVKLKEENEIMNEDSKKSIDDEAKPVTTPNIQKTTAQNGEESIKDEPILEESTFK